MAVSSVLSVRIAPQERELLEFAAKQARSTLSDFVKRKALEAAEAEILERRSVTIAASDWQNFEAWVRAPAKEVPALRDLAAHRPTWSK